MSIVIRRKVQSLSKLALKKLENNPNLILKRMKKVPYYMIQSVVKRCTPEQLLKLEKLNKSYKSETQELWKFHCKNKFSDIRAEADEGKLEDVEDWRDLYWARQRTEEARLERIKEKMKLSYSKLEKSKQQKSLIVADIKPNRMRMRNSSSSTISSSHSSSMKIKKNTSLIQKARIMAKRSSANFDIPIQNHSFSGGVGLRNSVSPTNSQSMRRSRDDIANNSNLQRMASSKSSSSSSRSSHGRSLSDMKSRLSSQKPTASDIMSRKRSSQEMSSSRRSNDGSEKKIKSSSWDASSSFFSKF